MYKKNERKMKNVKARKNISGNFYSLPLETFQPSTQDKHQIQKRETRTSSPQIFHFSMAAEFHFVSSQKLEKDVEYIFLIESTFSCEAQLQRNSRSRVDNLAEFQTANDGFPAPGNQRLRSSQRRLKFFVDSWMFAI